MSTATERRPSYSTRHRSRNATLEAAVWLNEGKNGDWYSVTLTKSWKKGDGYEKSTVSFPVWDLLPSSKLLDWGDYCIGNLRDKDDIEDSDGLPVAAKKRGRLDCAIWHDSNENGDFFRATLKRSYQDAGEWKSTSVSLDANEVLEAGRLLTRCFDAIDELSAKRSSNFVNTAKDQFNGAETTPPDDDTPF